MNYFEQFLNKRGYTSKKLNEMFSYELTPLKNTKEACAYLHGLDRGTRIRIMSDFDVDGFMCGLIAYLGFHLLGFHDIQIINRVPKFGYEFGIADVNKALPADLLFTCDVGISCYDAISYAREQGLQVIVTDHHVPDKDIFVKNKANLIINPHMDSSFLAKNAEVSGSYVVYQLFDCYAKMFFSEISVEVLSDLRLIRHFAAVSTVSDSMPLLGFNHFMVDDMLKFFNYINPLNQDSEIVSRVCNDAVVQNVYNNFCKFINVLRDEYYYKFDMSFLEYTVIPVLNTIKRMDADVSIFYHMMFSSDGTKYAEYLKELNKARKELVKYKFEEIYVERKFQLFSDFIYFCDAPMGILGLLAAKIMNQTQTPVVVLNSDAYEKDGIWYYSGSVRSPDWYAFMTLVNQSGLAVCSGHKFACGITVPVNNLQELFYFISDTVSQFVDISASDISFEDTLNQYDVIIDYDEDIYTFAEDIRHFMRELHQMGPFGKGFPAPNILLKFHKKHAGLRCLKNNEHMKVLLGNHFQCLLWNCDMGVLINAMKDDCVYLKGRLSKSYYMNEKYTDFVAEAAFDFSNTNRLEDEDEDEKQLII